MNTLLNRHVTASAFFILIFIAGDIFAQSKNIWISAAELADRPVEGPAWNRLLEAADAVDTLKVEGGHESVHDVYTMAAALVAVRLNDDSRRQVVVNNLIKAIDRKIEKDGNSLSLTRSVPGYIIAADLIDLNNHLKAQ